MRSYVWTTSRDRDKGRELSRLLDLPLTVDGPVGDCDLVHVVGIADAPGYVHTACCTGRASRRAIHWSADDVRLLIEPEHVPDATHFCETEHARRQLAERGVEAVLLPWPVRPHPEVTPLPEEPTVTVFIGERPYDFCADVVKAAQQAMPGLKWIGQPAGEFSDEEVAELVRRTTVHVRLSAHDTDMASPRVYMEAGRRALVSNPLDRATVVDESDFPAVVSAVRSLVEHKEPDEESAAHWREVNSEDWFRDRLEEEL